MQSEGIHRGARGWGILGTSKLDYRTQQTLQSRYLHCFAQQYVVRFPRTLVRKSRNLSDHNDCFFVQIRAKYYRIRVSNCDVIKKISVRYHCAIRVPVHTARRREKLPRQSFSPFFRVEGIRKAFRCNEIRRRKSLNLKTVIDTLGWA